MLWVGPDPAGRREEQSQECKVDTKTQPDSGTVPYPFAPEIRSSGGALLYRFTFSSQDLPDLSEQLYQCITGDMRHMSYNHITIHCPDGHPAWLLRFLRKIQTHGLPLEVTPAPSDPVWIEAIEAAASIHTPHKWSDTAVEPAKPVQAPQTAAVTQSTKSDLESSVSPSFGQSQPFAEYRHSLYERCTAGGAAIAFAIVLSLAAKDGPLDDSLRTAFLCSFLSLPVLLFGYGTRTLFVGYPKRQNPRVRMIAAIGGYAVSLGLASLALSVAALLTHIFAERWGLLAFVWLMGWPAAAGSLLGLARNKPDWWK
jgi:hypothetical protein